MTRIGRHLRGLWGGLLGLVLIGIAPAGCSLVNLLHMPGDLAAEARSRRPVTRNPIPGPVEAELYRACDEKEVGRIFLIDTEAQQYDLKLRARQCDEGDGLACGKLAPLFLHNLSRRELAVSLFERACDASDGDACYRVAAMAEKEERRHERDSSRPKPDQRIQVFYDRGCDAGDPRACLEAGTRTWDFKDPKRSYSLLRQDTDPDLPHRLDQLDRGCRGGVTAACDKARTLVTDPSRGLDDPQLAAYYAFLATFAPSPKLQMAFEGGWGPRPPSAGEIAAAMVHSRETEPERWAPFADIDRTRADRVARYRVAKEYSTRVSTMRVFGYAAYAEDTLARSRSGAPSYRAPTMSIGNGMGRGQGFAVHDPPTPECGECLTSCPGSSGADPCFCRCLKAAGGCAQAPRSLDLCIENDSKKLNALMNAVPWRSSY